MNLENITDYHEKVNNNSSKILTQINNRIIFLENQSNLTPNQKIKIDLDFKTLFNLLKINQTNQIKIFNKLNNLKLEDGSNVLNLQDKMSMLKNINLINATLNKSHDLIPDYNLNLENLPELNIELSRPSSPLENATIQVENLNTTIEKT
jgi:hypothetical protein